MCEIVLSQERIERVKLAFKWYWLSPFCTGTILLGEPLLSWALKAEILSSKGFADAYDRQHKIAYQFKTGLLKSPLTFARLTTSSQSQLVNSPTPDNITILGYELLQWVQQRIQEPIHILGANEVRIARLVYTRLGDFTYYERLSDPSLFLPEDYTFAWSKKGNALEAYRNQQRWFSWYPRERSNTRNANQLHFHGEKFLVPEYGSSNRIDFRLGKPAQITSDQMMEALRALTDNDR